LRGNGCDRNGTAEAQRTPGDMLEHRVFHGLKKQIPVALGMTGPLLFLLLREL
jgi:hypothetical protein